MKYLISLMFCFSILHVNAQSIDNLKIEQSGGEINLHYDLTGNVDDLFAVSIFYSNNNTEWNSIEKIYGDVGDSIKTGKAKTAVVWADHLEGIGNKTYFKVKAEYYTVDKANEGNVNDKNGYTYNWIRYGKNKWMVQNLKSNNTDDNCGGFFNNTDAKKACPEGWKLPSDEDWMALESQFGVKPEKVKEFGLREIDLTKLNNSGFIIEECKYEANLYPNQKALAFWTSTENKMLYTGYSEKYLSRIIRLTENKISKELRNVSEKLNVRCVQSSVYLASIEAKAEISINMSTVSGLINHPFTGEKIEWRYIGDAIWLMKDITGSYYYKETDDRCPAGWRLPIKEEWEAVFNEYKPSIKLENRKEILSDRLSGEGIWGFNLSGNDYWIDVKHYTYNTYWINNNDKEDSKKTMLFPGNKLGQAGWVKKQTNEKAKVKCVLDNKEYMANKDEIKKGSFTDSRDSKEYGFVEIDNTVWMSQNLNYDLGENSMCRDNIKTDCELFGHMYNIEVVESGCPDGWRLPTSEEWKYLLINKAANNLKILYPFGGTGFNLLLGGEMIYDEESKMDVYTAKYLFFNGEKPGYYYIDSKGKVELGEKAKKKDFYYVRCVKK